MHLVDKEYFLVTRIVDLFLAEPSYAAGTRLSQDAPPAALALYRPGARLAPTGTASSPPSSSWSAPSGGIGRTASLLERFFRARDALARVGSARRPWRSSTGSSRTRVWAVLTRLAQDDRSIPPPLEPMLPALAETVLFWSGGRRQVLVIHDEQSALTADRLRRLQRALADSAGPWSPTRRADAVVSPLAGLVMVDSRDDPRVQVADLLAGLARRVPPRRYDGRLRPFLSPTSLLP